ncbi:PQQ-dependent sugar dehydrogenase [Salinibius halmophilus]|uniref:PQQ-dependent sugar dehydrogenase n=1 Tax=Salinibius halmophilus TaxID=1853216 RepID=UPI000E665D54|nr:PQQ-dependent sugar dehydrogenase [Salinibius halmophilus]
MRSLIFLSAFITSIASAEIVASGTHQGEAYEVEKVASGLSLPWAMTIVDSDTLFVNGRLGESTLIDLTDDSQQSVSGLPEVWAQGQGGLLDVLQGPEGWLYFTYSKPVDNGAATTLARAQLDGSQLVSWQDLLVTDSASSKGQHFGSRIEIVGEHVYFTIGDRGDRDNGQNSGNHAATIIRLNLDGSVPEDNPFVGTPAGRDEIYSWGHRNPQGIDYDPVTNTLWSIEHGPRGGDEINIIEAGENYGWPLISWGKEYWGPFNVGEPESRPGYKDPEKIYVPSIAPSSLVVYRGEAFPNWQGTLFASALVQQHLNHVDGEDEYRLFEDFNERMRALTVDDQGRLLIATDSGNIYRVQPR